MEYKDLTILEIQDLKRQGKLSYYELTEYYLKRIKHFNKLTNSIAEKNKHSLIEAKEKDSNYKEGLSPLYGIPVLIKDNINTLNMKTTAGSILLKDFYSKDDAFIIKQLKKQGAIILGKTNLSEFANFVSWDSKNGHSALKGQVINPYGKDLDVGGSSSGSGASIATSLAQVAVGTETSGSILSPALQNSIVGLKPSVGSVSRTGIIPISPTQDVPGPMTRNVIDACILFNAMIGKDEEDSSTKELEQINLNSITKPIKGLKLGYVKSSLIEDATKEEIKLIDSQVETLKKLGAEIVEFHHTKPKREADFNILFLEFPEAIKEYFMNEPNAPVKSLKEVMDFNNENKEVRIPFGQGVFDKCIEVEEKVSYEETLQFDKELSIELERQITEQNLDALIFTGYYGTWLPAKAGFPSIVIPAGYIDNRPFGITFTSTKFNEETLLRIAYNLEQHSKVRIEPKLIKTA